MSIDTRTNVINLLETCQERKRKIALLHYELEHPAHLSETEMISTMALGHGKSGGHTGGYVSDKTFYIALNYQSKVDRVNADTKEEIVLQLVELEQIQKRLEYYVSLLEDRQADVVRLSYVKGLSQGDVAKELGIVPRTVRRIKNEAIDRLVEMYTFTKSFIIE